MSQLDHFLVGRSGWVARVIEEAVVGRGDVITVLDRRRCSEGVAS